MIQYFPFNEPLLVTIKEDKDYDTTEQTTLALGYWLDPNDPTRPPCYCIGTGLCVRKERKFNVTPVLNIVN